MLLEISGLPLHPLVVHAVVVLLPLATLGALAVAARPRWAGAYGPLVTVLAVVGAVAAFVAQQAGEALQAHLLSQGDPLDGFGDHSALGHMVLYLGVAFALAAVVSTVLARRAGAGSRPHRVAAWLAAGLGVAATAYAYLAGESGASSVWGYLFA
ncbi:DUF2231 domain-containing protein [Aquipuribacter hungaricus]|uniref:DUF2231 domain-containing protein n=1 Tax=Aquipuribacter hungaricus TaxID=545624 RepID=A0ABV7WLK6_9MICO